jgi:hypothetical protein
MKKITENIFITSITIFILIFVSLIPFGEYFGYYYSSNRVSPQMQSLVFNGKKYHHIRTDSNFNNLGTRLGIALYNPDRFNVFAYLKGTGVFFNKLTI